jgi:GWxTD domain-containing protein
MKCVTVLLIFGSLLLNGCSTGTGAYTECYSITQYKRLHTPSFDHYFLNVRGSGKSRIDVFTRMQFRDLRFQKKGEGYNASYTMKYIIRDSADAVVRTMDADRSIDVRTYEESISRRSDAFLQSFQLEPGRYSIEIESFDKLSNLRSRTRKNIHALDLSAGPVRVSSPLFLNTRLPSESGITLRPVLPAAVSTLTDSIGVFQEIYNCEVNDTIRIVQRYRRAKVDSESELSYPRLMPPYRMTGSPCAQGTDSIYFQSDTSFVMKNVGTFQSILFFPLPMAGHSAVQRNITITRNGRTETVSAENGIFRRDPKYANSVPLHEEVQALRFIIQEELFDSLILTGPVEKNRLINEFWGERGGPDRRKEFLRRIGEANTMFTECDNGSRTPMGIISIICGTPDLIECKGDFAETWYYTIGERSYPVQFRGAAGNGRLYELEPFSVSDVLWQYSLDYWRRKR